MWELCGCLYLYLISSVINAIHDLSGVAGGWEKLASILPDSITYDSV